MHAGFLLACGVVANRCHTQTITATSSTKAELLAAVEAAKIAKCLCSDLRELGFSQDGPTPIYEDNESTVNVINGGRCAFSTHRHSTFCHPRLETSW
jgi:hypothetical protein